MDSLQKKFLASALLFTIWSPVLYAQCDSPVAVVSALEGTMDVRRGEGNWNAASIDEALCAGDALRVGRDSRGALTLADHTLVRLGPSTTVNLTGPKQSRGFLVELLEGITHFMSRVPRSLEVQTPFVNAGVEGTEFQVRVDEQRAQVTVIEGRVAVENGAGRLLLADGQSASAGMGTAPVMELDVRPRDAVKWTLYYPALLSDAAYAEAAAADSALGRAVSLQSRGQTQQALQLLEQAEGLDADALTYRASLRLSVGQEQEAREDIARVLRLNPRNGDALALRSIIEVVQGDKAKAHESARAAVAAAPDSPAPRLALSYALQAAFDIGQAHEVMTDAASAMPSNSLVRARLAELHLMSGDIDAAVDAARRAVSLDPASAHAHMVLGFAHLAAIDTGAAAQAFERAAQLNPSMPLPRLGLGLAMIREGRLEEGRRAIEIAAILDPGNALVRSYLGKAYFEEKRDEVALDQYELAKQSDPMDPTPFFYSAIAQQTGNRPIEALDNLQQAIEKNDNRAVYRSRLLLDEDLATRGASVAGIYSTLGFEPLARTEATHSIDRDPGNYSAHRLLSDSYAGEPRHDIARASELLKSQLLQPLNHTPVQPQIAESDLFIVERSGAADPGYHEYHPLFVQDGAVAQASVLSGTQATQSNELILSGTYDGFAYSLGRYQYESDGFRENNDLEHEIYNVFGQVALSPRLNVQMEIRQRETDSGDLALRFDPEAYNPLQRMELDRDSARLGLHYQPRPGHHLLISAIRQKADDLEHITLVEDLSKFSDLVNFDLSGTFAHDRSEDRYRLDADQIELQYLHVGEWFSATYGAGSLEHDHEFRHEESETFVVPDDRFIPVPPFPEPNVPVVTKVETTDLDARYRNAYAYFNINAGSDVVLTLGAAYDSMEYIGNDSDKVNPKLGLSWQVAPSTRLRAAWFKKTKRPYASNQTLEPTQIAGFNQFFDETPGSEAERYGIALDHSFSRRLHAGLSGSRRESEQPRFSGEKVLDSNFVDEEEARAYLFWTFGQRVALRAEFLRESITQSDRFSSGPAELDTRRAPIGISYFNPAGFFVTALATAVDQRVRLEHGVEPEHERFWNLDASVGYKLPRRYGLMRIRTKNLLDEEFSYQNRNFNFDEPVAPQYLPERVVLGELQLTLF